MNNENLRTLAELLEHPAEGVGDTALLARGVLRLLDENLRLSEQLADEMLDNVRLSEDVGKHDAYMMPMIPDGFQEVIDDE